MSLNISQQKENFLIQPSMSRDKLSLDLDGGASWQQELEVFEANHRAPAG